MVKASGNTTAGKRGTRNEARRDTSTTPLNSDGKALTNIVFPKLFIAGQERMVGYLDHLTTIDMSFATWKQRSRFENSLALGVNDGLHPGPVRGRNDFPQASSQSFSSSTWTRTSRSRYLQTTPTAAPSYSMDNCDQILNGKVGIGMSTGRTHPPHLQQIGSS